MTEAQRVEVRSNPWLVTLALIGVGGILLAGILALILDGESRSYLSDEAQLLALGFWSNFFLMLGAISVLASMVVGGVEWALRQPRPTA